ncbi:MAG: hypothetical protein ACI8QZ_003369 [Chlamydiales bacterium]|jgi:hypothetical protein
MGLESGLTVMSLIRNRSRSSWMWGFVAVAFLGLITLFFMARGADRESVITAAGAALSVDGPQVQDQDVAPVPMLVAAAVPARMRQELAKAAVGAADLEVDVKEQPDTRVYPYDLPREFFWARILAAEDGRPLAGAEIWEAGGSTAAAPDPKPIAVTGPDGLVTLQLASVTMLSARSSSVGSSSYVVLARGRAQEFFNQQLTAATPERAYDVALAMAADLEVLVVDPAGHPLEGADVRLAVAHDDSADLGLIYFARLIGARTGFRTVSGVTDRLGRASFNGQPSAVEVRVQLLAPGFGSGWQFHGAIPSPLLAGERRVLTIVARMPADVYGVAVDETGAAAAGVELRLLRDEGQFEGVVGSFSVRDGHPLAVTGSDGAFLFKGVPVGRWTAVARSSGAGPQPAGDQPRFAPYPLAFEVTGIESRLSLDLELRRGLSLHGVALDERGVPCVGAEVDLRVEGGPEVGKQIADARGEFAFHGLPDQPLILKARVLSARLASGLISIRPGPDRVVLRLVDR